MYVITALYCGNLLRAGIVMKIPDQREGLQWIARLPAYKKYNNWSAGFVYTKRVKW